MNQPVVSRSTSKYLLYLLYCTYVQGERKDIPVGTYRTVPGSLRCAGRFLPGRVSKYQVPVLLTGTGTFRRQAGSRHA
jgi:hypothetical protein